jgi:hypothetical protein
MLFLVRVELVFISEPLPTVGTDEGKGLYGGRRAINQSNPFSENPDFLAINQSNIF